MSRVSYEIIRNSPLGFTLLNNAYRLVKYYGGAQIQKRNMPDRVFAALSTGIILMTVIGKNRPRLLQTTAPYIAGIAAGVLSLADLSCFRKTSFLEAVSAQERVEKVSTEPSTETESFGLGRLFHKFLSDLFTGASVERIIKIILKTLAYGAVAVAIAALVGRFLKRFVYPRIQDLRYKDAVVSVQHIFGKFLGALFVTWILIYIYARKRGTQFKNLNCAIKIVSVLGQTGIAKLVDKAFATDEDIVVISDTGELVIRDERKFARAIKAALMQAMRTSAINKFLNKLPPISATETKKVEKIKQGKEYKISLLDKTKIVVHCAKTCEGKNVELAIDGVQLAVSVMQKRAPNLFQELKKRLSVIGIVCLKGGYFNALAIVKHVYMFLPCSPTINFTSRELASIFAHEFYHLVNGHVRVNLVRYVTAFMLELATYFFKRTPDKRALLLFEVAIAYFLVTLEKQFEAGADAFAVDLFGEDAVNAMRKLAEMVKLRTIDRITADAFESHGDPFTRVKEMTERLARNK